MWMAVVQVGVVRMTMHETAVAVPVRVWLATWIIGSMGVLMMLIVNMPVLVLHLIVRVFMLMALREMEPQPECHQPARDGDAQ
jgi:hypothetical protein